MVEKLRAYNEGQDSEHGSKKGLHDGIIVLTIIYASETRMWNERIRNKMNGQSNENVYNKYGISSRGEGMESGVIERVKHSSLRWFRHRKNVKELNDKENVCE